MKTRLSVFAAIFITAISGAPAAEEILLPAEILFHDGPDISIELESSPKAAGMGDELSFKKLFYIDPEVLRRLPANIDSRTNPAIAANVAINAAKASVDLGKTANFRVVRLDFLRSKTARPVDYYLIEMEVNGSSEHRIVLMDGSVLKPRLKQVAKP